MRDVAEGLDCAHKNRVIHRDLKPANIMVLPDKTVKLMDFGIARVMREEATRRTRKGEFMGTLPYMAPEQFRGLDADERSDIFSYGVIYYELITESHPFRVDQKLDVGQLIYRITSEDPIPITQLVEGCPELLNPSYLACLQKTATRVSSRQKKRW